MKQLILSVSIDSQLHKILKQAAATAHLSRSDIVRQVLREYFGLTKRKLAP